MKGHCTPSGSYPNIFGVGIRDRRMPANGAEDVQRSARLELRKVPAKTGR